MEDRWKQCATRSRCTTVSEDQANLLLTMSMELHSENMATVWSACRGQAAREIEQGVRAVTQCPIRASSAVMLPTAVTAQHNGPMVLGLEDPLPPATTSVVNPSIPNLIPVGWSEASGCEGLDYWQPRSVIGCNSWRLRVCRRIAERDTVLWDEGEVNVVAG